MSLAARWDDEMKGPKAGVNYGHRVRLGQVPSLLRSEGICMRNMERIPRVHRMFQRGTKTSDQARHPTVHTTDNMRKLHSGERRLAR